LGLYQLQLTVRIGDGWAFNEFADGTKVNEQIIAILIHCSLENFQPGTAVQ